MWQFSGRCSSVAGTDISTDGLRFENNYVEGLPFLTKSNHFLFVLLVFEKEYHSIVLAGLRFTTVLSLGLLIWDYRHM